MSDQLPAKTSAVEGVKEQSRFLAGDIGPELCDGLDHFGKGSEVLLKFHGTYQQNIYRQPQALADQIAAHFAPRTKSYHEIWLTDTATGEKELFNGAAGGWSSANSDGFDVEPIYGKFYMPRKFKMAIGYTFDN